MDTGWIAIDSCTLPTAEQPWRLAEFDELFTTALEQARRTRPDRLRLTLRGGGGLPERVRDLTERESTCCSFFTFTLTPVMTDDPARTRLLLDIAVPPNRIHVLDALADRTVDIASRTRP